MKRISKNVINLSLPLLTLLNVAIVASPISAQIDVTVSQPQGTYPIAVAQLCDGGGAGELTRLISDVVRRDLDLSSMFNVLPVRSYVEEPGRCGDLDNINYSDWSVIGADGVIKGVVRSAGGDQFTVELFLYNVPGKQRRFGKRYTASGQDARALAHRFVNEVIKDFTGVAGPFGTRVAYVGKLGRFKELFVMDLDGANNRQLTRDRGLALSPSWAASGDQIVYTSYATRSPEIFTVGAEGGRPRQVTRRPGLEMGAEFMPDGRFLMSMSEQGNAEIVITDSNGAVQRKLTSSPALDVSPALSPDGSRVAFCSDRGGKPQVYVMPVGGGEARRVSYSSSDYCTSPSWSADGKKIAYVCRGGGFQIFMSDVDGANATQLTFGGDNEDPIWSPDGRYLLVSTTSSGGRRLGMIYTITGQMKMLSDASVDASQPAWLHAMQ